MEQLNHNKIGKKDIPGVEASMKKVLSTASGILSKPAISESPTLSRLEICYRDFGQLMTRYRAAMRSEPRDKDLK